MTQLFTNNGSSALVNAILAADVSIEVADPAQFPVIGASDEFFLLTIEDLSAGKREIVKVTATVGAVYTVERAQENTPAQDFDAATRVELRMTRGTVLRSPEISDEDILAVRMKMAVVNTLPASPAADTVYFIIN